MGKTWPALGIHVPGCDPQLQELVLAELDDFQPTAIQDADDCSPLRAFFDTPERRDAAARALATGFGSHVFVEAIDVDDEDWAARSQAQLGAITIGRITVYPPWAPEKRGREGFSSDAREKPSRPLFCVIIRPSMGFGTGHHATTRLMLKLLQEVPLEGRSALDIGCGSGVLAIAAAQLGARSSAGIDVDPDALQNARENVGLNGLDGRVHITQGDFRQTPLAADLVMANLTGGLLERSAASLSGCVTPGGHLIVSGFMASEEPRVVEALTVSLVLQRLEREEEWMAAVLADQRSRQI